MWLNILIAVTIGILTYSLTVYFDNRLTLPQIQEPVSAPTLQQGQPVPEFEFTATDGKTRKISDFKGRVVILNFWASWCPPCLVEFPALIEVASGYDSKDVVLLALSSDHDPAAMNKFLDTLRKNEIDIGRKNILIARDEDTRITHDLFQTFRLPETIIIGPDQTLRHKLVGANWEKETLKQAIDALQ